MLPLLSLVLMRRPGEFNTLCEIGCCSGRLLRESIERLPQLVTFIGLNTQDRIAQRDPIVHGDREIRFETAGLLDWSPPHGTGGTMAITDAEQFDAIPPSAVCALWQCWRLSQKPIVLALAIPMSPPSAENRRRELRDSILRYADVVHYSTDLLIGHTVQRTCWLSNLDRDAQKRRVADRIGKAAWPSSLDRQHQHAKRDQ